MSIIKSTAEGAGALDWIKAHPTALISNCATVSHLPCAKAGVGLKSQRRKYADTSLSQFTDPTYASDVRPSAGRAEGGSTYLAQGGRRAIPPLAAVRTFT